MAHPDTTSIIEAIRAKFDRREYEFSEHAVGQSVKRRISVREIEQAVRGATIIEDYPGDKYGPSCLLFGFTQADRPLHIHCSYPSRPLVKIITVYEPDPEDWIDGKTRRNET